MIENRNRITEQGRDPNTYGGSENFCKNNKRWGGVFIFGTLEYLGILRFFSTNTKPSKIKRFFFKLKVSQITLEKLLTFSRRNFLSGNRT